MISFKAALNVSVFLVILNCIAGIVITLLGSGLLVKISWIILMTSSFALITITILANIKKSKNKVPKH